MDQVAQFELHSLRVNEQPHADGGQMTTKKVLTFHVGVHGPFTREFVPASAGTSEAMKTAMTQQVAELQAIHEHQPGVSK